MVEIFDDFIDTPIRQSLSKWFMQPDSLVDDRLDVRSKKPVWSEQNWPRSLVEPLLDKLLDRYEVEQVLFLGSRISFRVHVDSGDGDLDKLHKVILMPLEWVGEAGTVFFNNYWHKASTRFSRTDASPFRYHLPDRTGTLREVEDIRVLLDQCLATPDRVTDFNITKEFIDLLSHIVLQRSGNENDARTSDYTDVINFDRDSMFDKHMHSRYLNHLAIENLHGLSVDKIVTWKPGRIMVFDRTQLHCATAGHTYKLGLSIFTNKCE